MIIINTRSWIWPADDDAASPQKIYFLEYFTGCNHLDLAAFITAWVTTPTHARITVDLISINNVNVLQDALEGSDRCWGSDRILPSSFWFSSPRNYWIIISDWCCACSCFVSISFQFLTGLRGYLIWWGFWISLGISLLGSLRLCHICNRDSQRFSEIHWERDLGEGCCRLRWRFLRFPGKTLGSRIVWILSVFFSFFPSLFLFRCVCVCVFAGVSCCLLPRWRVDLLPSPRSLASPSAPAFL